MAAPKVSRETSSGTKLKTIAGGAGVEPPPTAVVMLDVESIDVGENVRKDVQEVDELAASVAEHGVLQPIKVRVAGDGYAVVWGQRRLLAARKAGLTRIPAIVTTDEQTPAELSTEQLVENLHRADLNPMDRARAMRAVVDAGTKQVDLAKMLGLAPSTVANDLRLLETHAVVQHSLETGQLSPAHARAIATLDVDLQADFAETVVSRSLSAHEAERQARDVATRAAQIRATAAKAEKLGAIAIALLEKVTSRDKAKVGIASYDGTNIAGVLKAAGWAVLDGWGGNLGTVDNAGECGCKGVWRLEIPYNDDGKKLKLQPGCENEEHRKARQAAEQERWKAQRAKDAAAYEASRKAEAAQAAAERIEVEALVAGELSPAPTAFGIRLAILAVVGENLEDLESYWTGEQDVLHDLEDPAWSLLQAIPDADLPRAFAKVVAHEVTDSYYAGPDVKAAIAAALGPVATTDEAPAAPAGLAWYGLRKSPNGGYTPAHEFPSDISVSYPTRRDRVATCGFDTADSGKNGYFDMLVAPSDSAPKAVQKKCAKCSSIANGRAVTAFAEAIAADTAAEPVSAPA